MESQPQVGRPCTAAAARTQARPSARTALGALRQCRPTVTCVLLRVQSPYTYTPQQLSGMCVHFCAPVRRSIAGAQKLLRPRAQGAAL